MPNESRGGLMSLVPRPGNVRDWRQVADMVTNPWIPGDWWNSSQGRWNNPMEAFGLDGIGRGLMNMFGRNPSPQQMSQNMIDRTQQSIDERRQRENQGQGGVGQRAPAGQRGGAAGSRTVAEGDAAQRMFGDMRDGANRAQLDAQAAEIRQRMDRLMR